ncbi:MAG TPA: hypothetical protein VNP20_04505, partial [Nocardioidaceae bacterium]|nr:hypothetical protein [Nocardioidaceae bacterium]
EIPNLTVVTNSVRVAEVLHTTGPQSANVVLTGGVRTPSDALVGPIAVSSLQMLHLDVVFLGVHGMDARAGFTTPNLLEAETNRAFVAAARRLADHTKWATVGISTIARLDEADFVVTGDGLFLADQAWLGEMVGELVVAHTEPTDADASTSPAESAGRCD